MNFEALVQAIAEIHRRTHVDCDQSRQCGADAAQLAHWRVYPRI